MSRFQFTVQIEVSILRHYFLIIIFHKMNILKQKIASCIFCFRVSSHALSLLAMEGKQADGLILESPFNNLRDELKEHPFSKVLLI
jgi:hypothetical protein